MKKLLILTTAILATACANATTETETTDISEIHNWTETDIQSGQLGGTYVNAGENKPVVIIVPGSGPTDKDGNNGGMTSNSLKFLAHDLAERGISSVRVDKRGLYSSSGAGNADEVSVEIYAQDYRNWVKAVTTETGRNCAYLLGHSEGGLMVSVAAAGQDNVCGVITVASPGFPLSDVLRKQLSDNPANAPILEDALKAIDQLESGQKVDVSAMHPALLQLFAPTVQGYLISLFQVDPGEALAKTDVPNLVIQGSHDIQVSVEDARRLSKMSGAELVILDGISHVLKTAPSDRMANIASYNSPDTPIDPGIVSGIADFIAAN